MKLTFERGALALVAVLVAGLMGAVYLAPPDTTTVSPRAILRLAAGAVLPPKDRSATWSRGSAEAMVPPSIRVLSDTFRDIGYDFDSLVTEGAKVPRIFLASVPGDMEAVREVKQRKTLFLQTVLPLVLEVNERIAKDRDRLLKIRKHGQAGDHVDAIDRLWLAMMAERYRVGRDDLDALILRVDIIPPSLALAQAAAESGWGISRFVREGNALFGQWTTDRARGLTPLKRDAGRTHKIQAFDCLLDSVQAYVLNLNRHRAYRGFRKTRAAMRAKGAVLDGKELAGQLLSYSEQGLDYVATLRTIITANDLERLDATRLEPPGTTASNTPLGRKTDA